MYKRQALGLLRLRRAHPLLRLGSAGAVLTQVSFPVSGTPEGAADLAVMLVEGAARPGSREWADEDGVLVVLNASRAAREVVVPGLAGQAWALSPVQREGADPVVRRTGWDRAHGRVDVPALTAAVLVRTTGGR